MDVARAGRRQARMSWRAGCTGRRVSAGLQRSRSAGLPVVAASSGRRAA